MTPYQQVVKDIAADAENLEMLELAIEGIRQDVLHEQHKKNLLQIADHTIKVKLRCTGYDAKILREIIQEHLDEHIKDATSTITYNK